MELTICQDAADKYLRMLAGDSSVEQLAEDAVSRMRRGSPRKMYPFVKKSDGAGEKSAQELRGDLVEHKKTCEAKPGNCPYERKLKQQIAELDKADCIGRPKISKQNRKHAPRKMYPFVKKGE